MTPQELNVIKALTKSIDGLTSELKAGRRSGENQVIYADNVPYLFPTQAKDSDKLRKIIHDILYNRGLPERAIGHIIDGFDDAGIGFIKVEKPEGVQT